MVEGYLIVSMDVCSLYWHASIPQENCLVACFTKYKLKVFAKALIICGNPVYTKLTCRIQHYYVQSGLTLAKTS